MSSPQSSNTVFAAFSLDSAELSKSAINTVRTTLGVSGAVALIVGILITFWPKNSLLVITVILAVALATLMAVHARDIDAALLL